MLVEPQTPRRISATIHVTYQPQPELDVTELEVYDYDLHSLCRSFNLQRAVDTLPYFTCRNITFSGTIVQLLSW